MKWKKKEKKNKKTKKGNWRISIWLFMLVFLANFSGCPSKQIFIYLLLILLRNKRIFEDNCTLADVLFRKFQVVFYMVLHFHEQNHFLTSFGWYWSLVGRPSAGFSGFWWLTYAMCLVFWLMLHAMLCYLSHSWSYSCFHEGLFVCLFLCFKNVFEKN